MISAFFRFIFLIPILAVTAFFWKPIFSRDEIPKDHVVLVRFHLEQLSLLIDDYRKRNGCFPPSLESLEKEYGNLFREHTSPFQFVSPDGRRLAWEYHPEAAAELEEGAGESLIAAPVFSDRAHGKVRVDLTGAHEIRIAQVE